MSWKLLHSFYSVEQKQEMRIQFSGLDGNMSNTAYISGKKNYRNKKYLKHFKSAQLHRCLIYTF
jgi:hypothetical protein